MNYWWKINDWYDMHLHNICVLKYQQDFLVNIWDFLIYSLHTLLEPTSESSCSFELTNPNNES